MTRGGRATCDRSGAAGGQPGAPVSGARLVPVTLNQADRLALAYGPAAWHRGPIAFGLRLSGRPEQALLEAALTWTARRHAALRMYFPELARTRLAVCLDPSDVTWRLSLTDLTGLSGVELASAERDQTSALTASFPADRPPLYRASLWKYSPTSWLLGIAIDHLLFDGVSIGLFLDDFREVYHHLREDRPPSDLAVEASDYSRFCLAERQWLASPAADRSLAFWRSAWAGCGPWPRSIAPTGAPGSAGSQGRVWARRLEAKAVERAIKRFAGSRLTLFAFAVGCVMSVIKDTAGRSDCGVLYSAARRSLPGTADMIGCLMNRMLLRVNLRDARGMDEIVARARNASLDAMDHEMMPFEFLTQHFRPDLVGQRPHQPHIAINVDAEPEAPRLDGLSVTMTWPVAEQAFAEDPRIVLSLQEGADESIVVKCGYQSGLFDDQLIGELMSQVCDRLTGARR